MTQYEVTIQVRVIVYAPDEIQAEEFAREALADDVFSYHDFDITAHEVHYDAPEAPQ